MTDNTRIDGPYRHIACCVDGHEASQLAADEAARLHRVLGGRLTFLNARESVPVADAFPPLAVGVPAVPPPQQPATEWLEQLAAERGGTPATTDGYPPAASVEWAAANDVDLLVAGAHRGLVDRMLLGGFAAYLAGHSPCSVLLVRPGIESDRSDAVPFRHIAACVDDSAPSRAALAEARRLYDRGADRLSVVHVAQWPLAYATMGYGMVVDPTDTFERAESWLNTTVEELGVGTPVFLTGYPPAAVCDWAREENPDLIVAASHRGFTDRILLGSFAHYVAYHAPTEVLLTRTPRESKP